MHPDTGGHITADREHPTAAPSGSDRQADEVLPVECPECGSPTTALALASWGNCRACRTAQSRRINPLRW